MTTENIILAFLLTLIAGLSTGLGGLIAFFTKRDNVHFLTIALGFSAGVMIFVSFTDIFRTVTSTVGAMHSAKDVRSLDEIIACDREARRRALELIK